MKTFVVLLLSLIVAVQNSDAQDGTPTGNDKKDIAAVIEGAVGKVVSVLKNKKLSRKEKRESVTEIVESLIDLELLAKLSLGKTHWGKITAKQRQAFVELFKETLRLSYFEKLELFTDETVEFEKPTPIKTKGSPKFNVVTYIISKGDRIQVSYMLTRRNGSWRVYDLEIEGVSIRKSYGGQYNDFLREKKFEQLLVRMRKKIAEANKKYVEEKPGSEPSAPKEDEH
jgi:phospholipid transport system substrate-binding protein